MTRLDALEATVGLGLITWGTALWSVPAALIVAGVVLLGFVGLSILRG